MAFITGDSDVVLEMIRKMGIDPSRCAGVTIHIKPCNVVVADIEVLVDEETIEFITKRFKFVLDEGDNPREQA